MMNIGIFAKTFPRPTLEATLDAVVTHGLHDIQFNMACAGLPSMPDVITDAQIVSIRQALEARQMRVAALSGTFNMIHPDRQVRQDGLRRLEVLAGVCGQLGTNLQDFHLQPSPPSPLSLRARGNKTEIKGASESPM